MRKNSVLQSNFIVSGVKSLRLYSFWILNLILFSISSTYIYTDGSSISSPCFFKIYSKKMYSWIFDPSGNSNSSYYVGADILNLLLLYSVFYVSPRVINTKVW